MRKLFFTILIILVAVGSVRGAERVLLFRFKGTGLDEELIEACEDIFTYALSKHGAYKAVRAEDEIGDGDCYSATCAVYLSREAGFAKAVTGNIVRLGNKLVVNVQLIDAENDEIELGVEGTSVTEDDLDVVLNRLAKSISEGKGIDDTAEVGMITQQESSDELRRSGFVTKGLRVGFAWPQDDSFGKTDRLTAIDFVVQHDTRDYFISGKTSVKWGRYSAFNFTFLETKVGRYLNRGDFSPFISAGVGLQYNRAEVIVPQGQPAPSDDHVSGTGLSVCGGIGVAVFRTYDFQLQLDLDYFLVFEKLEIEKGVEKYPQGVIFTFCLKY